MTYLWDSDNVAHIARHEVTSDEAEQVLENDPVDLPTQFMQGELRFPHLGETNLGRVLLVVVTEVENNLRVVTAFRPAKRYLQLYERQKARRYADPVE